MHQTQTRARMGCQQQGMPVFVYEYYSPLSWSLNYQLRASYLLIPLPEFDGTMKFRRAASGTNRQGIAKRLQNNNPLVINRHC